MDFSKVRNYLFIALLGGITIVFFWLLKPFAYAIFWAAVIAALFYPAFLFIDRHIKHRSISAFFSVLAITLIIIIPIFVLSILLIKETIALYNNISSATSGVDSTVQTLNAFLKNNPVISFLNFDQKIITEAAAKGSSVLTNGLVTIITSITQNSFELVAMFIIMLYTLFFFLRDGEMIVEKIMYLSPLGSYRERSLYAKFTTTASSMIRGTIFIGGVQGLLCGIVLAIAGLDSAIIWGIVTMFASVIPGAGAALIWLPAGIYLFATGHIWQAIMVLVVGATIISTIDNFLRPLLVGKEIKMHPLLILFSTLGGIALFGVSGFLIGPIFASLFITFWEMYEEYFQTELTQN
jgi:predicted PurR-regulated permease PerM